MGALDEAKDDLIDGLDAANEVAVDVFEFVQEKSEAAAQRIAEAAGHVKDFVTEKLDDSPERVTSAADDPDETEA